ncbi:hypothetical protein Tco_1153611 [Tanacetum coccineum]
MGTTRAEQIALDDALVAPANRLKIAKCNLRLSSDLKSKEATLQVVYDVLKLTPFYKAFQISADVPEIYMQDGVIKVITDVNVNKLHQPWRSFAAVINKCLSGKNFVYQVENKNVKKSNEMYYPCFTKLYGAILPNELTNKDIRNFESYKEYYAIASRAEPPKTKAGVKKKQIGSNKTTTYSTAKGKRLKTSTKIAKPAKKKQPVKKSMEKGLTLSSEVALTKAEQLKLVIERSKTQTHISHKSSEEDNKDEVDNDDNDDDVDKDVNDDDAKNPDDANQDDDDEQTDLDNDGDDFVHPKLSTHDDEARKDDEVNEEKSEKESDDESNKESDEEVQGANTEEEEMEEEATHEEDKANELYRDVNVNLEGRDTVMTDAPLPNVQATQETEDTHVILTAPINPEGQQQSSFVSSGFVSNMLNPRPDKGIDSIFTLNIEATLLVDVPVTTIVEPPLLSATTLPPPPNPLITHLQQTSRLRDEAQAENADFINKLDDNIKKIFKDQVKEQTSLAIAANLSKLELKKILIDKMESNKEDEDKDEEHSAGSNQGSKRRRAGKEPESTSAPKEKTSKTTGKSTEGSKSHHKSAGESTQEEEPMHTAKDLEEPVHQEFETGVIEDQPNEETSQHPDWFQKPAKLPNPDRDWNKTLPDAHGPVQPWLSSLTQMENPRDSFDKLMDTTLDFSAFVMNRLKVDTLTPELLTSPTFELMKGTCKSLVELEYFFEEVYKATTDQID